MKFLLQCKAEVGENTVLLSDILDNLDAHRDDLGDVSYLEGELSLAFNDAEANSADYSDPVLRLAGGWLRKVAWVIAGDTETVALRNSEHCYAFMPQGNGVEVSFYEGDEAEIETYVIEPTTVSLSDYAEQSIALGDRVWRW